MASTPPVTTMSIKVKSPFKKWSYASTTSSALSSISMPSEVLQMSASLTWPPVPLRKRRPCWSPTPTTVQPCTVGIAKGISSALTLLSSESSPSSSPARSPSPVGWSWMASQFEPPPWNPWSQSKLSSPQNATSAWSTVTEPPKNSMPSSKLDTTSTWWMVVPDPTPARVKPLISLAAPSWVPPWRMLT